MFGIFGKSRESPVEESRRKWIDSCFIWMLREFGAETIRSKPVLTPTPDDFPIIYTADEDSAYDLIDIIAPQMDIDPETIEIDLYTEAETEITSGIALNARVFLKAVDHEKYSAGHYRGRDEDGLFHIGLEQKTLKHCEGLIAVIAHELSHVKLLGEGRIEKNNEALTDLTTIVFGLGIFGANAAFQMGSGAYSWGYRRTGYLTQMEWGYALALFARIIGDENPSWMKYLTLNVREDLKQGLRFMQKHPDEVMRRAL